MKTDLAAAKVGQESLTHVPAWQLALYSILVFAAMGSAALYLQRFHGVFACGASGYRAGVYLSDCAASRYGDYDHGAFWFGLEPAAASAARSAEVLFLGNSRMQFAASTAETRTWFTQNKISYYLLGLSDSETAVFTEPLLDRMALRPKVIVVNVDRFFTSRVSPPAQQIFEVPDIESRYRRKQDMQQYHRAVCGALPDLCGNATAVFREFETGAWHMTGRLPGVPAPVSLGAPTNEEQWPTYIDIGARFIERLGLDRRCIILTTVPTVDTKWAEAQTIAKTLGLDLIAPELPNLTTFDGSHLDGRSASLWSFKFLEAASDRIRACVPDRTLP